MYLITTQKDVSRTKKLGKSGALVMAGSQRIFNLGQKAGIDLINPEIELTEGDKQFMLEWVCLNLQKLEKRLFELDLNETEMAVVRSQLTKYLFGYSSCRVLKDDTYFPEIDFADLTLSRSAGLKYRHSNPFSLPPFIQDYTLDFTSSSARLEKTDAATRVQLSARHDPYFGIANSGVNITRMLLSNSRFRMDIAPHFTGDNDPSLITEILKPIRVEDIESFAQRTLAEFQTYNEAMKSFLAVLKRLPTRAQFNNVGEIRFAGYINALDEYEVPTELYSHGAMIGHGEEKRKYVSTTLANALYNSFPGIRTIIPRSTLQVPEGFPSEKVRRQIRAIPKATQPKNQSFTIYYAPNFLSWHQCLHGLSTSCFETRSCADALVAAFKKLENATLNIRIKTTAKDNASAENMRVERGLLPADLDDLYDPTRSINNCALGSHSKLIEEADLVVTEGITAVMFEAIEYRKPVLLLNKSEKRTASLPAMTLAELKSKSVRSAVYATHAGDALHQMLEQIRTYHLHEPLTDTEISKYVWCK